MEIEMRCPVCVQEKLKSTLRIGNSISSLLSENNGFYDENGKYHRHSNNQITTEYFCSNEHKFIHQPQARCWCGWIGRDEYLHIIEDEPGI